jgi:hypothetical protein
MSVSNQFYELNPLRPANARFAEVTGINLTVTFPEGAPIFVGFSKRKSIHVPASSNAYWNWVNLRTDLVRFVSERGLDRRDRIALQSALNDAIRKIHEISLRGAYSGEENGTQYFELNLKMGEVKDLEGTLVVESTSSSLENDDPEGIVYKAYYVV